MGQFACITCYNIVYIQEKYLETLLYLYNLDLHILENLSNYSKTNNNILVINDQIILDIFHIKTSILPDIYVVIC